jgi:AraC-like DNA-binding protein
MRFCRHVPAPPLNRHIAWFWYYDDLQVTHAREHVLPDGGFELIFNLDDWPRKLFHRENTDHYQTFKRSWLSGAQSGYLVIDVLSGASMIGAHFFPGGISAFLFPSAGELTDRVAELDGIWGAEAAQLRQRLLDAPHPRAKFRHLETFLLQKLRRTPEPGVSDARTNWALRRFVRAPNVASIAEVAEETGVSQRQFIADFRRRVGVTPKLFCRIRRFQEVLAEINARQEVEWADVALACGYYDQAHFINDFRTFSGLNPTAYLRCRTDYPNFAREDE